MKKGCRFFLKTIAIFVIFFGISNLVFAQSILDGLGGASSLFNVGGTQKDLLMSTFPEKPAPGKAFTVYVATYSADLDRALISWYLNGSLYKQDAGLKQITLIAPEFGKTMNIEAVAEFQSGTQASGRTTISGSEINLLWQAQTYTPPFYQGKALPAFRSKVTVLAVPNMFDAAGNRIENQDIVFNWTFNGDPVQEGSGIGRDSIVVQGNFIDPDLDIQVAASSIDGSITAEKTINLAARDPILRIYQNHPTLGVLYNHAAPVSFNTNENEIKLEAVPYYFSVKKPNEQKLIYSWITNNTKNTDLTGPSVGFVNAKQAIATNDISVKIQNQSEMLQSATSKMILRFQDQKNSLTGESSIQSTSSSSLRQPLY